jgi:hypothetical protein
MTDDATEKNKATPTQMMLLGMAASLAEVVQELKRSESVDTERLDTRLGELSEKLRRSYEAGEHGALMVDFVRKGSGGDGYYR